MKTLKKRIIYLIANLLSIPLYYFLIMVVVTNDKADYLDYAVTYTSCLLSSIMANLVAGAIINMTD